MNKSKKIQLIIVCVIFLIILASYLGFKYHMNHLPVDDSQEEVGITVTNIDTSLITEIGIITEEETLNLQKDGETWKCPEDDAFSVDEDKLQAFLDAAGNISSELLIEDVTDMEQYGLENPAISISLQWDSNLYTIKIGDQNTIDGGYYYLSINDENTVYTLDSLSYYSLNKGKEDFELAEAE